MKNTKLWIFLAIVLVTAAGSLFAGGSREGGGAQAGPVTIELWYGASVTEAGPPPSDWEVFGIVRDKLNIDLKISSLPSNISDQNTKINAAAASNTLPDIFQVERSVLLNLVKNNLVGPVDDLLPLMPNRTKVMYDADARKFCTINGKLYGLASPNAVSKNEGVLIRQDWLDKLGLKTPVTTEDFFNVMKAFTFNDPDGNGRADTWGYGAFIEIVPREEGLGNRFAPLFGAFGVAGTWNMTKADFGLNVRKPAYYDAIAYIKRIVDEKVIDPNWTSYGKDDFRAAWKQGRFGIMREQNAAYAAENNYAPFDKNFPNGSWSIIDPPKGPQGKLSAGSNDVSYRIYAVSANAIKAGKGPAIAKLLNWMSSDEGYYLLGWGKQGVNYMLNAEGNPTNVGLPDPSKAWTTPEVVPITQLRNMVYYNSKAELDSRYPTYKTATSGKTMSALTALYEMQSKPWTSAIGADSMPMPNADLKRFYEQGVVEFLTGKRPLSRETWAAWVAEFDKLGGLEWEKSGLTYATENSYLQ